MEHNNQGCPEYLFVAWNGRQFPTAEDCERLHELARYATREAGLQCYWISLECMAQEDEGGLSQMALDVSTQQQHPRLEIYLTDDLGLANQ
jgi:hypothetical protein